MVENIGGDITPGGDGTVFTLTIAGIPPHDTGAPFVGDVEDVIRTALRDAGKEKIAYGQDGVRIEGGQNAPGAEVIVIIVTALTAMAVDVVRQIIIPALRKRYQLEETTTKPADKGAVDDSAGAVIDGTSGAATSL